MLRSWNKGVLFTANEKCDLLYKKGHRNIQCHLKCVEVYANLFFTDSLRETVVALNPYLICLLFDLLFLRVNRIASDLSGLHN